MSQTKAQLLEGKAANIEFSAGTAALPAITFTGDLNTGIYSPAADTIAFAEGGAEAMRIDSSGRVGIGTTSPAHKLVVSDTTNNKVLVTGGSTQNGLTFDAAGGGQSFYVYTYSGGLGIYDNSSLVQRVTVDNSGRLLVGTSTSSANGKVHISGGLTTGGQIHLTGDITGGFVGNGDVLGRISFGGSATTTPSASTDAARIESVADATWSNNSDTPTRLVFSTTADGASSPTERMRITQGGLLLVNRTSTAGGISHSIDATGTSSGHNALICQHLSSGNDVRGIIANAPNCTTDDGYLFIGGRFGADKFYVRTSGNVQNTNNSYGAISDQTLKQDIVPAGNQWEDIRSLQVKKYRFKDEPDSPLQIGLIAQDVEQISPGLVETNLNREDSSRSTKSIKYSVLYMKAVKALQEAMERIEVLEQRLTDAGIA